MTLSQNFGFEENQLVVFKHIDTSHPHIHIVGDSINVKSVTTAEDSFSKLRTRNFCRKIKLVYRINYCPKYESLITSRRTKKNFSRSKLANTSKN